MFARPATQILGSEVHGLCIQTPRLLRAYSGFPFPPVHRSRDTQIPHNIQLRSSRSVRTFATPSSTMSAPKTMKAVDIKGGKGGIDALFINSDSAVPTPKPTDALVKIKAFGLNRMDRTFNSLAEHHSIPLAYNDDQRAHNT